MKHLTSGSEDEGLFSANLDWLPELRLPVLPGSLDRRIYFFSCTCIAGRGHCKAICRNATQTASTADNYAPTPAAEGSFDALVFRNNELNSTARANCTAAAAACLSLAAIACRGKVRRMDLMLSSNDRRGTYTRTDRYFNSICYITAAYQIKVHAKDARAITADARARVNS
eukprot:6183660-Pleurochrysis_carterae.AAC.4